MIESVAALGRYVLEKSNKSVLEQMIENPNYDYCMFILLSETENGIEFTGVDYEEVSTDYSKYLFRSGSSRGANFSPTAKITTLSNTYDQKILGWFRGVLKEKRINNKEKLEQIYDRLVQDQASILAAVSEKIESLDKCLISVKLNHLYPVENELFTETFLYLINKKDLELSANNQICSICKEQKDTVIGKMSAFKFYTLDKPGFITGGFQEETAWRNYPVCLECKSFVEAGKEYIENHLKYQFYGLPYLLIPSFLINKENTGEDFEVILEIFENQQKMIQLSKESGNSIMTDEGDLLYILSEQKNTISLKFLFMQKIQSAERILLVIDDVLPSRLQKLFKSKEEVEKVILFKKETNEPRHFHFGFFRTFFAKSDEGKKNFDLNKYFLTIVESSFKAKQLELNFLLKYIMKEIRKDFLKENEQNFYWKIKQAMACLSFLEKINVLQFEGGQMIMSKFNNIFEVFGKQLNTNEKRAIFLLGSMTQILLEVQQKKRNSKPFLKQLMGLKMDEQSIKGLLPKVINKFIEYDAYTKPRQELAEEISSLFLQANEKWKLSIDEINFYFVCGMSLASKVKEVLYEKEEVIQ
ncbi:TIGR02556 family CRISPR-associated protein [Ureibacillus sp. FSL W7-1570]|uniref:TIGR02556 family CRISPR-associated protein n=1 Tax=Ureibacillus sp. FSL W7-1570 TaxID=2954593 RepID=UPI00315A9621